MPVRSKAQQGWLAIHRPDILKRWMAEYPHQGVLPKRVKKKKQRGRKRRSK